MPKKIQYVILFAFAIIGAYLIWGCAKEATPSGGPKDYDPPVVTEERPPNYSKNFNENKIKIYFDEFVKLKNLQKELLISPPFQERPEIIVKGKKIVIYLPDSLPQNKTVNISFYDAIVDVNENNALKNYQYVFATGSKLDTSFIDGKLTTAKTGLPRKNELIHVYETFDDSIVSNSLPAYMARSNKDGIFVVNNLGEGPYKLFALSDENRNDLYDQPTESIAFINDSVIPDIEWTTMVDTLQLIDSVRTAQNDTIFSDSIVEEKVQVSAHKPYQLRMFIKDYHKHYMTSSSRIKQGLLSLGFNRPLGNQKYNIKLLTPNSDTTWYRKQKIASDSLHLWITDSTLYNSDSIYTSITYPFTDTTGNITHKTDSIYFNYDFTKLSKTDTVLILNSNLKGGKLHIDTTLQFLASEPLKQIDTSLIQLHIKHDTVFEPYDYQIHKTQNDNIFNVSFEQNLLAAYKLTFDSTAISGIYNHVNDSLDVTFKYYEKGEYGNFILIPDTIPENALFRLYKKDEKEPIRKLKYPSQKPLEFNQLLPGKYELNMLIDKNQNGEWDTGNYYKNILPELVIAFEGEIIIKGNWDTEQNWALSKELYLFE